MNAFSDTWYLFMRHIKVSLRTPIWLFVNLVQPLVWLLLFSRVFERMVDLPGFTSDSYLQFFAPGVIIMTVLFGSAWTGMNIIQDMDLGILDKMLATPVTRVSIVLGQVFGSVSTLVVQALLIFLIAWIMGVDIATGFPGGASYRGHRDHAGPGFRRSLQRPGYRDEAARPPDSVHQLHHPAADVPFVRHGAQ